MRKRATFTLDAERNTVRNGSIINAVTVDQRTLGIQPFFNIYRTPQRFTRVSPRLDYQLNENNTLIFRYSVTHSDINGAGIGGFDLIPRGYEFQYLNQTVQLTETAVLGNSINETRFQYFRSANQRSAKTQGPGIQVLGAFVSRGAPPRRAFAAH